MPPISSNPHPLRPFRFFKPERSSRSDSVSRSLLPCLLLILLACQAAAPLNSIHSMSNSVLHPWPGNLVPADSDRPAGIELPADTNHTALNPDPTVQGMLNQVQSSTLSAYVSGLSGEAAVTIGGAPFTLDTRSTTSATYIEKATQYAYEHFQSMGLAVSYHTWQYNSGQRRNVVAEQPGSDATCLYLLTAHLDDTSQKPNTNAPGADDNASGTAGVLAAADILSHYDFICTLRYVLFTGEEQDLLGSWEYAQEAAQRGDPILGVLNLDMIAYNTPASPATIEMDIRSGPQGDPDRALTTLVSNVIQAYQLNLTALVYASDDDGSDHYSFWEAGYPAVEVIEDWDDHSPYYHTTSDTLSTLNLPYFTAYVKAMLGTMAHLGQLASTTPPPAYQIYLPLARR
jgi:hypothetical protein